MQKKKTTKTHTNEIFSGNTIQNAKINKYGNPSDQMITTHNQTNTRGLNC